MKFTLFAVLLAAIAAPQVALAMSCPDVVSPGVGYCMSSCGCYCGSDNRIHCDELSDCQQTSGSAKQSCIDNCTCP
ncbi:hypothetical protein OC834_004098 [Tilletia horrida]|nr:hypothetical protein OC835_004736 [Tilletia horrida]KAK0528318.1 hypothetical protein OC834_004098 [Tilletia horrida]